ncbi:unnamed protein product, partial [Urochloa humidicola]
ASALKNPEPCWRWEPRLAVSPPLLGQTGTASHPLRAGAAAASRQPSRFGIGTRRGERRVVVRPRQPLLPLLSAPAYPRPAPPPPPPPPPPYRRRTMSSSPPAAAASPPPAATDEGAQATAVDERVSSHVDPFLIEALDNPRHRLMVLRMELDIQKFLQNPQLQEFEFQNFPTSYLRCAAHRVAQHYGLETTVADSLVDGSVSRIVARKTPETRYPPIALSEVPSKQARNDHEAAEKLKFVIYQRPKAFQNGAADAANKNGAPKTVEERTEEYNKARARIFNGSISADTDAASVLGTLSTGRVEPVNVEPSADEIKVSTMNNRSRVAVFKDTEKDRSDPDYDRNYKRYVRSPVPDFSLSPGAFNFVVPQFMQYGVGYVQSPGMSTNQPAVYFGQPDLSMGSSSGAVYPHWPTPAMMYPHCYDNTGPMISQVPLYQSFNHG